MQAMESIVRNIEFLFKKEFFLLFILEETMKKIKSYTSIWAVEKVIYAINDFQLPFPVTFNQMAWFVLSLMFVIVFGLFVNKD